MGFGWYDFGATEFFRDCLNVAPEKAVTIQQKPVRCFFQSVNHRGVIAAKEFAAAGKGEVQPFYTAPPNDPARHHHFIGALLAHNPVYRYARNIRCCCDYQVEVLANLARVDFRIGFFH